MGTNNRLAVSTQCPSCGAHLEFVEGNNAVRCEYCRSHLLLTGRRRILAFFLPPLITEKKALECLKKALLAGQGPRRVVRAQLCFFPYYRLTGHDFIWRQPPAPGRQGLAEGWDPLADSLSEGDSLLPPRDPWSAVGGGFSAEEPRRELQFQERYLEKNFLALDVPGLGAYSLGVRPAVMTLHLYDREALQALGKIMYFALDPESATQRGLEFSEQREIERREVLAKVLSVIFFPFWVIETEHHSESWLSIIDGASGTITRLDLPPDALQPLQDPRLPEVETVGFLPMLCPNCGWELSGPPDSVIFSCDTCNRAWLLGTSKLSPVECRVAGQPAKHGEKLKYLPFWVFEGDGSAGAGRLYVPAFRYRRLKALHDTTRQMFRRQPGFELSEPQRVDLEGCYYDSQDARLLAEFMLSGMPEALRRKAPAVSTDAEPALVWFPFLQQGTGWINPITGSVLQAAQLA